MFLLHHKWFRSRGLPNVELPKGSSIWPGRTIGKGFDPGLPRASTRSSPKELHSNVVLKSSGERQYLGIVPNATGINIYAAATCQRANRRALLATGETPCRAGIVTRRNYQWKMNSRSTFTPNPIAKELVPCLNPSL